MSGLIKVGKSVFELPIENGMNVKGVVFINDAMAADNETIDALKQLRNVACLPGVKGFVAAMPDIHYGYGFPIGGVAATEVSSGVISPGGVGYDINCGVRAIRTNLVMKEVKPVLNKLLVEIYRNVPAGVGSKGTLMLSQKDEKKVVEKGAAWAVENGLGTNSDLDNCENGGRLRGADYKAVSQTARERGQEQLGTLGAGNHFLEICYVKEIFQKDTARGFGIRKNQVFVFVHTGSRGFGYQICDDYLKNMRKKRAFELPDQKLASIYIGDSLGEQYIGAMKAAANYAWANRQIITSIIRKSFENVLGLSYEKLGMSVLYDVSHNIARFEQHVVDGSKLKLCVHRKGATRAFPKGSPDIPKSYRDFGQPVLIPGDMGRGSYILKGEQGSILKSFGTTCHGAGRVLSRKKAVKIAGGRNIKRELDDRGILVLSNARRTLMEEMPEAYKNISSIVDIVEENGLASKVARLTPLGVIKG
jgi:tRNA-splicing ligase RtcB